MALDLLFPHFDELIRKPEDVQRLNEAILQLAVQGKLMEQDPNDEPASELLKRIEQSRAWLPPIEAQTAPFAAPSGWTWVRLGNLAEVVSGVTLGRNLVNYETVSLPYLRVANVQRGYLDLAEIKMVDVKTDEKHKYLLRNGDLLLTEGGDSDKLGRAAIWREQIPVCIHQNHIFRARPLGAASAEWLMLCTNSPYGRDYFLSSSKQTTNLASINSTQLKNCPIALPPIAEQQRILAKVDQLFAQTRALEARLRQAQADVVTVNRAALHRLHTAQDDDQFQAAWRTIRDHFDVLYDDPRNVAELRQTILDLAVRGKLVAQDPDDEPAEELLKAIVTKKKHLVKLGRLKKSSALTRNGPDLPHELPDGWCWALVDDLCYVGTGSTPRRDEPDNYEDGQIPWITSAVTGMPFITEASEYISERALAETNCQVYPKHTLIVGMYGQGKTRGQVSELLIEASTNQACAALVFDGFSDCIRPYVKLFFQKNYLELRKLAEGGAQPNLNVGKIRSASIPVPPLAEQERIMARVDQLMELCDELEAGLVHVERVRRSVTAATLQAG